MSRAAGLRPVVAAFAGAERVRLAAHLARIAALRARADACLRAMRVSGASTETVQMIAVANWQSAQFAKRKTLLAEVTELDCETARLQARLARALGRETAVEALAAAERTAAQQRADRRAEDDVPAARREGAMQAGAWDRR